MMDASYAAATLRISTDDTMANLEVVATLTVNDTNTSRVEAVRASSSGRGSSIFPDPTRGHRYLMDFVANRSLGGTGNDHSDSHREMSRMQLVWSGKSIYRKVSVWENNALLHIQTFLIHSADVHLRVRGAV